MTRFFFDLHSDSLSTWDDDGRDCRGADEILRHALSLLNDLPEAEAAGASPAVVSVHDDSGHVVLTATVKPRSQPSLKWMQERLCGGAIIVPPQLTSTAASS
ncbi:DUF6894 family protein [Methylobacterium oxalidis]|uniref:DUF6894 family protein n=1 Tax=Methylobacterium oxalidis TaxID=944322 RepID=UPI003314E796